MRGVPPSERPHKVRRSSRLADVGKGSSPEDDFELGDDSLATIMRSIPMPEVMRLIWNRLGQNLDALT